MSLAKIDIREFSHQPAAVGTGETKDAFQVRKGERILWASARVETAAAAATTSTWDLGDPATPAGYVAAVDAEQAVGTLVNGAGTYLANSGGKLYVAAANLRSTYTPGATPGATNPRIHWKVAVLQDWP